MHGRSAIGGLDGGPRRHQLLALDQLRNQPIRFDAFGVPHLDEVDARGCAGRAVSQLEPRLAETVVDNGRRCHAYPGVELRSREVKRRSRLGLAALDQIQLTADVHRLRIGRRKRHRARQHQNQILQAQLS